MIIDQRLLPVISNQPYPLLFTTISGAHLYGFPSPDSDYDLRGAHILSVPEVVGLNPGRETIEVSELRDQLQIDLVTHDIKKFFSLLLKKNGYVLEQLYSPLIVHTTPAHEELKAIAIPINLDKPSPADFAESANHPMLNSKVPIVAPEYHPKQTHLAALV